MLRQWDLTRWACLAVFVIIGGSFVFHDGAVNGQAATQPDKGAGTLTRYSKLALLVGINDYKYKGDYLKALQGAVHDAKNMKRLLVERFGFPDDDDHIRVLTDKQATRDAILRAIKEHLIAKATRDTIVVFHYSGHGSHVKDMDGDEIDGYDETIVPYDSGRGKDPGRDITDDEINALLGKLTDKAAHVTFIFDSCHSGTASRAAGLARTVEPDDRPPTERDPLLETTARGMKVKEGKSDLRPEDSRYVLIAGCAADEQSYELSVDGQSHGALTWHLANEIRKASPGATYRDIMDLVKSRVSAAYRGQHPQLEGPGEDQLVFSQKSLESAPYIVAKTEPDGFVTLEAGQVHGVTLGSVYDIYPPGTKSFGKDVKPLAQVEVTDVEVTTSRARITKGHKIEDASRAVEREHRWPDPVLRVHFKDLAGSETLQKIKADLQGLKQIISVERESGYDLLLREHREPKDGRRTIVTEGGDPREISPRVSVTDPDVVSHAVKQLTHWAKWFNILRIENQQPELSVAFGIKSERTARGEPGPLDRQLDLSMFEGEKFSVTVTNKSEKELYIALLDLCEDGSVEVLYPLRGQQEFIAPGKTWERRLETTLPGGRDSVRDILKLIVTTRYTNFSFLQQAAVRDEEPLLREHPVSPLEELLANAALGTARNAVKHVDVGNWTTVDRVLEVRRRKE
jgi:hypothetical protein